MQTIRQVFILLRQNPLLSTIFILGTAFAITMIMAIVITWQMKYADIEPEVNRNRSLYISKMHLQGRENKNWNNYTACSPAFMKNCVQPLPEVEACTAFVPATVALVSMPDGTNAVKVDAMETTRDSGKCSGCSLSQDGDSTIPTGAAMCPPLSWLLLWRGNCSALRMRWARRCC